MKIGDKYNWVGQPEQLIYLGKEGSWHQFKKIDNLGCLWRYRLRDDDLHMIEETVQAAEPEAPQAPPAPVEIGELITFKGEIFRVACKGELPNTFDLHVFPRSRSGDQWRNVPATALLNCAQPVITSSELQELQQYRNQWPGGVDEYRASVEGWQRVLKKAQQVNDASMDITEMINLENMTPLDGLDEIYKHYATTFGRTPDAFMANVVKETKARLMIWWMTHREEVHATLSAPVIPVGWKLVPIIPTKEMLEAGKNAHYEAEERIDEPNAYEPGGFANRVVRAGHVYQAMVESK